MALLKVIGRAVRFGGDFILNLTDEQLATRAHRVDEVEGGHRPREPIEFKAGEVVDVVSGDIAKHDRDALEEADQGKGARKGKPAKVETEAVE